MVKQIDLFNEEKIQIRQAQIDSMQYELNYDTRDYPIDFIVQLFNSDNDIYAPDYQRNELLWSIKQKSRFIESIILDYPIPLIFLGDTDIGRMEIIDGLQRISTLSEFLNGDLELKELSKLTELINCTVDDLPPGEIRRFKARSLRVIVLKHNTPAEVRIELFDRLNTSSLHANSIEIRSGREQNNPLMSLIKELSQNELFKNLTNLPPNKLNRKEDLELISRFFAYSNALENYNGKVLNFIDEYIKNTGNNFSNEIKQQYINEFNKTMAFVKDNFIYGFKKEGTNQTPRVRFEALSVGINLALRENSDLIVSKENIEVLLNSEQFKEWTTSDAANNKNKVLNRINGVKNFLLKGTFDD